MDPTAIAHCMEHDLPILVFNYRVDGNIERAVRGEDIGTRVSNDDRMTRNKTVDNHGDTENTEEKQQTAEPRLYDVA